MSGSEIAERAQHIFGYVPSRLQSVYFPYMYTFNAIIIEAMWECDDEWWQKKLSMEFYCGYSAWFKLSYKAVLHSLRFSNKNVVSKVYNNKACELCTINSLTYIASYVNET